MKKIFSTFVIFALLSTQLFAEDKTPFVVNPTTIRTQMFSKNITLLQALNNVQASKLNVSMARAKLLPSLNLGVLLPALANPTFLIASITFLFPFLIPSNWATLKQSKDLFEADKVSYKVLELNILSNALSIYYTHLTDTKVLQITVEQREAFKKLYTNLKKQSDVLGNVTSEDLSRASAELEEANIRVSKLQELLVSETASVRTMLGLPLGTPLTVEDVDLEASEFEDKNYYEISEHSLKNAPESQQLDYLVKAAAAGKFAKMFGFVSQASMSGQATGNSSAFDNMKAGGNFSFGADNIVNIKLANNNLESIKLRIEQLKQENEKLSEIVVGQMREVKSQNALYTKALKDRVDVYRSQLRQYTLGLVSLQTLLQTEAQLTDSRIGSLKADLDLKMQRLTLKRLVLDGDFSKVKGCQNNDEPERKGLFGKFKKEQSLDKLCQQ